jgi:hypothetical protein
MKKNFLLTILFCLLSFSLVLAEGDNPAQPSSIKRYSVSGKKITFKNTTYQVKIDSTEYRWPFITIQLAGLFLKTTSSIRIDDNNTVQASNIDFERDFEYKKQQYIPRGDLKLRLCKRHQLAISFLIMNRNRTATLNRTVQFNDTSFSANSTIRSKNNIRLFSADYRFSIIRKPAWELGILLGAKFINVYTKINSEQTQFNYTRSRRSHGIIPVPGIHGSVYLGKHILLTGIVEYLSVSRGNWNFKILQIRPTLEFYPFKHVGIGVAYNYLNTEISKTPSSDLGGNFKFKFNATSLFASFIF